MLVSVPSLAAAQPDPADKPVVYVPYPPDKPIEVHGSVTDAVAAATADRTLRAESMDGLIVNTIYLRRRRIAADRR